MEKRTDKPLCPYCHTGLELFALTGQVSNNPDLHVRNIADPKYHLQNISLYCPNDECKGISLNGENMGYDIRINNI